MYEELKDKGIVFQPSCYLAEEWLTPENEPVIGIPFYLAHPTLIKLEKKMMLEAEGETRAWCMQLLRHETGHALAYAYRLNRKKKWREVFGSSDAEYGETYRFHPYSKNFVRHLDGFYAQYHPDEDFSETFAVWLTPGSKWDEKYQGWKALRKLRYVDQLMKALMGKKPAVKTGRRLWSHRSMKSRLESFYRKRRKLREEDFPDFHDGHLRRIFDMPAEAARSAVPAGRIIKEYRKVILQNVSHWTGEKKYVINDLLKTISKRSRKLKLSTSDSETDVVLKLTAYLTTLTMNYLYTGWYRGNVKRKR